MTDAYKCEKCGGFYVGNGRKMVYGERKPVTDLNAMEKEICDKCKSELDRLIDKFFAEEE